MMMMMMMKMKMKMMMMMMMMMMIMMTLRKMSHFNWIGRVGFPIRLSSTSIQGGRTQGDHHHHLLHDQAYHHLRRLRGQEGVCDAKEENAGVDFCPRRADR